MKTKTVTYQKVFNLGDYSNEKIGVDLELEEGDNVQDAVNKARDFVENQHQLSKKKGNYLQACSIVENPHDYTGRQIEIARQMKSDYESMLTDTPKLLN
jgi:uncharacterized membrane protein YcgQ (UPF0703/DUF1980 family)